MRAILGVNVNIAARRCRLRPCHPDLCEGKGGTVSARRTRITVTLTTFHLLIANAAVYEPPINVCFQGKSGHDADMAKSTRLTQIIADPTMFDCYANRRRS